MPPEGHSGLCLGPFALDFRGEGGLSQHLGAHRAQAEPTKEPMSDGVSHPVKSKGSGRAPFTSQGGHSHPPWVLLALESCVRGSDFTSGLNTRPHLFRAQTDPFLIPIR